MSSKVYFSDLRALPGTDLLGKLKSSFGRRYRSD